jgi:hypothetical protein
MGRHVARMRDWTNAYTVLVGKLKGSDHLENISIDDRMI